MNILKLVKPALTFVASTGTGFVVSNIVNHHLPQGLNRFGRVQTFVGSFVISSVLTDLAVDKFMSDKPKVVEPTTPENETIVISESPSDDS